MKSKNKKELNLININSLLSNRISEYFKKSKQSRKSIYIKSSPTKYKNSSKNKDILNKNEEEKFRFSLINELYQLEESFKRQFFKDIKNKKENEIKAIIPQKKIDYENRANLIISKCEKELMNYKTQYKIIEKKNKEIKNNLEMIKKEKKRIYKDLKEANLSIEKINKKYELYNELRPYYESLAFEFNIKEDDKIEPNKFDIENNFKTLENFIIELEQKLKDKNEKIYKLKNEAKKEEINNKNSNKKLYNYFIDLEKKDKIKEEEYKKELANIREDINNDKISQKENDKILNIFISIYNLLYQKLNLQRDIIQNPKNISLIKTDYIPQVYITDEIINYIILMLNNSNEESCSLLLREIISYANMILREYNSEFNRMKYDPEKTTEEIEKYINKIKEKNKLLKDEIENIKQENKKENEYIDKINKQIKQINNMYDKLHYTLKMIYINSNDKDDKKMKIKRSLSDNNINDIKDKEKIEENNNKRFIYLRKYIEGKKNKKIIFGGGFDQFVSHTNRLMLYKNKCDIKPKDIGVYINTHKRMEKKFYKLKKLQENRNKYTTIENAITSNINENIDKLVFKIHQEIPDQKD